MTRLTVVRNGELDVPSPLTPLRPEWHAKNETIRMVGIGLALGLMFGAFVFAPLETLVGVVTSALLTCAFIDMRHGAILEAAKRLSHTFAFTDSAGLTELRDLSRAVFLWNRK